MKKITDDLKSTLEQKVVKDNDKLKKQQRYYQRLKKGGIAQKQTYSLKAISAI